MSKSTSSSINAPPTQKTKLEITAGHNAFMAAYKILKCKDKRPTHDKRQCMCWHNKGDRRRSPYDILYSPAECSSMTADSSAPVICADGDSCLKAHNMLERMFHPELYKISSCQREPETGCDRGNFCAFAHSEDDLRIPPSRGIAKAMDPIVPSKTLTDSKALETIQDKLVYLIKSQGVDGIISSELPKRYFDSFAERLDLTDEAGERFRIKDILVTHPNVRVEMHKGVQPKYVYRNSDGSPLKVDDSLDSGLGDDGNPVSTGSPTGSPNDRRAAVTPSSSTPTKGSPDHMQNKLSPNAWSQGDASSTNYFGQSAQQQQDWSSAVSGASRRRGPSGLTLDDGLDSGSGSRFGDSLRMASSASLLLPPGLGGSQINASATDFNSFNAYDDLFSTRTVSSAGGDPASILGKSAMSPIKQQQQGYPSTPPPPGYFSQVSPPKVDPNNNADGASQKNNSQFNNNLDKSAMTQRDFENEIDRLQLELQSKNRDSSMWMQQYQEVSRQLQISKDNYSDLMREKNAIFEEYKSVRTELNKRNEEQMLSASGDAVSNSQLRSKLNNVEMELEIAKKQIRASTADNERLAASYVGNLEGHQNELSGSRQSMSSEKNISMRFLEGDRNHHISMGLSSQPLSSTRDGSSSQPYMTVNQGLGQQWTMDGNRIRAMNSSNSSARQEQQVSPVQIRCAQPGCREPGPYVCSGCSVTGYCGIEHQRYDLFFLFS